MCRGLYEKVIRKIGIDKIAHLFASAFLALAIGQFTSSWIAGLATVVIGLAKELFDSEIDWKDLIADCIGVIISMIILIVR